jgi:copper(I)-binding protein
MNKILVGMLLSCSVVTGLHAELTVKEPWVRATVAAQKATGAFMTLSSDRDVRLVSAQSPVAGLVELHEMSMEDNVMKMRALPHGLDLPSGKAVVFKPGGYHFMLLDLKQPVSEGKPVPITLTLEDKSGKREVVDIKATVRPLGK